MKSNNSFFFSIISQIMYPLYFLLPEKPFSTVKLIHRFAKMQRVILKRSDEKNLLSISFISFFVLVLFFIQPAICQKLIVTDNNIELDTDLPHHNGFIDPIAGYLKKAEIGNWLVGNKAAMLSGARKSHLLKNHADLDFDDIYWDDRFTFQGINGIVYAIAVAGNGDLYVGGSFTLAGTTPVNNIARWDGSKWYDLRGGIDGAFPAVYDIEITGNDVYITGDFSKVGNQVRARNIARWDGHEWYTLSDSLENGIKGIGHALAVFRGDIYVGGVFYQAGDVLANNIACWSNNHWSTLGSGANNGLDAPVLALAASDTLLYLGGAFTLASTVPTRHIAGWNGNSWSVLGTPNNNGTDSDVRAISVDNDNIYVGGTFREAGGDSVNYIARYDGKNWFPLGEEENNGVNGWVYAITSGNDGKIYVGGTFQSTCQDSASLIAVWDGKNWASMNKGLGGGIWIYSPIVFAMAAVADGIYAGGSFSTANEISANCIVKWHDNKWHSLLDGPGLGLNDRAIDMAAGTNGDIYVGGGFTAAGDIAANYIARWNGKQWFNLGSGLQKRWANLDPALVIKVADNGDVYVGGIFIGAGGVPANNIARWDGEIWSSLGTGAENGLNESVYAIALAENGDVYVGGDFTMAGTVPANYIARWDGENWHSLGTGVNNGVDHTVSDIAIDDSGYVYVGGSFKTAGGDTVNGITRWDGSSWKSLNKGFTGEYNNVYTLAVSGNDIYAGGYLTKADTININYIARWDGNGWHPLGSGSNNGVNDNVFELEVDEYGNLYAGGWFSQAGNVPANLVARWDGNQWHSLGSGIGGFWFTLNFGTVFSITTYQNNIYFGGAFSLGGEKPSHCFALWNKPVTPITYSEPDIKTFPLLQNYPNPFNLTTTIAYQLPERSQVRLAIYDIAGRQVRTLVNAVQLAGNYHFTWDGTDEYGRSVSSGVYISVLEAGKYKQTKKLILLK
jgi:hypothetical protein